MRFQVISNWKVVFEDMYQEGRHLQHNNNQDIGVSIGQRFSKHSGAPWVNMQDTQAVHE